MRMLKFLAFLLVVATLFLMRGVFSEERASPVLGVSALEIVLEQSSQVLITDSTILVPSGYGSTLATDLMLYGATGDMFQDVDQEVFSISAFYEPSASILLLNPFVKNIIEPAPGMNGTAYVNFAAVYSSLTRLNTDLGDVAFLAST